MGNKTKILQFVFFKFSKVVYCLNTGKYSKFLGEGVRFRQSKERVNSLWLCTDIYLEGLKKTRETAVGLDYILTEIRN